MEMELDFDKLLEGACERADALCGDVQKSNGFFTSLDSGLTSDDLYLNAAPLKIAAVPDENGATNSSGTTTTTTEVAPAKVNEAFNTSVAAGRNHLTLVREKSGANVSGLENASAAKPRLDLSDSHKDALKKKRKESDATLKKWFGMKKQELTPEKTAMLTALKLRGFASKNKFYKGNDSNKLPEFFQIGTEIAGGLGNGGRIAVGGGAESQAMGTSNRKKNKGRSLLQQLINDADTKSWVHSKNSSHMEGKKKHWVSGAHKAKARKKVNHKQKGALR